MKKLILFSSLFILGGCGYLDSEPPAGRTEGYVHEPIQDGNDNEEVEIQTDSESAVETEKVSEVEEDLEDEVQLGMAIFVPDPELMVYLPIEVAEEERDYTEDELIYWNNLAIEYGLPTYDGVSDFNLFATAVQKAIDSAQESVYEEPVYEEPVYEEPVYEEPSYEEPDSSSEESSYEEPIDEGYLPEEETPSNDYYNYDFSNNSNRSDVFGNDESE
ncbi:hypothetical protein HW423_05295 [Aerococcaceae bacterium INB8]|uniref:Uncharacterized protein n=1 Tax=Ruoffia halotolerans TaxID=2748684 RepID=A0A839A5B1_9LACT|nr:hypothetical protein [Ruoffia halotolerans]MBA5729197.1 hypothetical protein [Ruoffia halotolerans]